jgi:hypothetical protein
MVLSIPLDFMIVVNFNVRNKSLFLIVRENLWINFLHDVSLSMDQRNSTGIIGTW